MISAPTQTEIPVYTCATHCPLYLYKPSPPSPSGPTRNTAHLKKSAIIQRNILGRQYFHRLIQYVQCFLILALSDQSGSQLTEQHDTIGSCTSITVSSKYTPGVLTPPHLNLFITLSYIFSVLIERTVPVSPSEQSDKPYRSAGSTDPISTN